MLSTADHRNRATGSGSEGRYDSDCTLPVPLMLPVVGKVAGRPLEFEFSRVRNLDRIKPAIHAPAPSRGSENGD